MTVVIALIVIIMELSLIKFGAFIYPLPLIVIFIVGILYNIM